MKSDNEQNEKMESRRIGRRALLSGIALAVIGVAAGVLLMQKPVRAAMTRAAQGFMNSEVRTAETESGNLLADAIRAAGDAEIALIPAAAFKAGATAPRPANPNAAADLVDPSSDTVVVMNVRGDILMQALERSVSFAPQPSGGFLQVSGIKFSFSAGKPSGSRVDGVTVGGAPLAAAKVYKVAMPRPLAFGQQGYSQVWDRSERPSDTGKSLATALKEYAASQGGSLNASVEGRISAK